MTLLKQLNIKRSMIKALKLNQRKGIKRKR